MEFFSVDQENRDKEKEETRCNDLKIPMKKLFIEMLEAGIEWYDDEQDTIDNQ